MIAAVEDVLSEAVVRKLMAEMHPDLSITTVGMRGRGYLQKKSRDLNRTARSTPVLILVDLDDPEPCPADLITDFLRARPAHNLVFRVAVMEIESWIIADREAFASFVGVPSYRIPTNTDTIFDPKEFVVNLARRSRRRGIRQDLVPDPDGTAAVGPVFNPRIAAFVAMEWSVSRAVHGSPSLRRAAERLEQAFGRRC